MMEKHTVRIINAKAAHIPFVAAIEKQVFIHPWSESALLNELHREDSVFLVALCGENVCGYINCRNVCGEGYVGNFAVDPAFRRGGVGSRLLDALIAKAEELKLDFLTLEVRASNQTAIRLYETLGFHKVGERKNFYSEPTENAILYTLNLPNNEGNDDDEYIGN